MSSIKLSPNASGTGEFTIAAPNSNTNRTLTLPDATGTVQVSGNPISGTTGTFTGLVDISAAGAGQIKFPATQNASSDANTLDDYEEGTWTPDLKNASSSSTFTSKTGRYTKIGRLVYCSFVVDAGNTGTAGSTVTLSGLPFAYGGTSNAPTLVAFTANGIGSATGCYTSRTQGGSTTLDVREAGGAAITVQLTFAAGTLVYEV